MNTVGQEKGVRIVITPSSSWFYICYRVNGENHGPLITIDKEGDDKTTLMGIEHKNKESESLIYSDSISFKNTERITPGIIN